MTNARYLANKKWRDKNSEKKKESDRRWREENKDKCRDYFVKNRERFLSRTAESRGRNIAFVENLKQQKSCIDCKMVYHHCQLEYDHVKGDKIMDISKMSRSSYSLKVIKEEIAKCELVCSNCHALRTFDRRAARRSASPS